jgi:hypothetical protein
MATEPEHPHSIGEALTPAALRAALIPRRPVFGNPWDKTQDAFICYFAVGLVSPLLLWAGARLMSAIFGFGSHWPLGVYIAAAIVGAAGIMTIVGRERTTIAVDVLAIGAWVVLGLVVAPVVGLAPPAGVAIILYAVLLLAVLVYVLFLGRFETPFLRTLSWPLTWTLLAAFFAFCAHRLLLYA